MAKKTTIAFIFFPLYILIFPSLVQADGNYSPGVLKANVERLERPERMARLQPERIVKTLGIKPGMTILDIGAGSGLFSFQFADALNGTGKVYATDIDPSMIEHIKGRAAESGYDNVIPVLVKANGTDPFYTQHQFDIIFMANVYYHLWHRVDYFNKLRPSLNKNGRLFILQLKDEVDFNEPMFSDFKVVMSKFYAEGEDFPVFQRLGSDIQTFIKNGRDEVVSPEIRARIVEDFNKMLSDRALYYDLLDYYYTYKNIMPHVAMDTMNPPQKPLIKWLVAYLDEDGVFSDEGRKLTDMDKKRLHRLNKILLEGIFALHVKRPQRRAYYLDEKEQKNSIIGKLKMAGYHFVRDHDFLAYYYFLEFKR